jgi:hypothetical protein
MKKRSAILMMFAAMATTTIPMTCQATPSLNSASPRVLMSTAHKQLDHYVSLQKALNIQNSELASAMRKALILASLLINTDGTLNIDLRESLKMSFASSYSLEYEKNMFKLLDHLDISWNSFFTTIKAPASSNQTSCLALRGLFSLKPTDTITDHHARVAVLSAMLSPYNQGPVGDCFAVADVIRNHQEYYRHAATDYASIIMQGFIERPVDNTQDYFFFLPILADDDRNQPFHLTSTGTLSQSRSSLFDVPGFASAVTVMGGTPNANLMTAVMEVLTTTHTANPLEVTPSQVIEAIAQVLSRNATTADQLASVGKYAFSCLTNNPILRGIESAFSSMAEDRPQDSIRGNINDCISKALEPTWNKLTLTEDLNTFKTTFNYVLNASYRIFYNLDIPITKTSSDGSSHSGGFQLYKRISNTPSVLGIPVVTPQDFRELILDAVNATVTALEATSEVKAIGTALATAVKTDNFLKNALWAYDPSSQQESNPIKNYQKLSRTPMQTCDGDNPFEVNTIDTQINSDSSIQVYKPKNPKELISWCLQLATTAVDEISPMDNPLHAFNFMPKNPDLAAFVKAKISPSRWIKKTLVIPGMTISRKQISINAQKNLAVGMRNVIADSLTDVADYQQLISNLATQKLNVSTYAQKLLKGINKLLQPTKERANQIALALDQLLIESLSPNAQAILSNSAIRFAFTNWNEGTKDIYFCAFFNPRTEKISFGSLFEDKTNLHPMDENEWVNNLEWDVNLHSAAPLTKKI